MALGAQIWAGVLGQNPDAFVGSIAELFASLTAQQVREQTSEVIGEIMERIRVHRVNFKGTVSTVVVTTLVLEGWSSKLNPDLKIMDALHDILPMSMHDRLTRTIDHFGSAEDLALVA